MKNIIIHDKGEEREPDECPKRLNGQSYRTVETRKREPQGCGFCWFSLPSSLLFATVQHWEIKQIASSKSTHPIVLDTSLEVTNAQGRLHVDSDHWGSNQEPFDQHHILTLTLLKLYRPPKRCWPFVKTTILTFSVSAVKCFAAVGVSGFRLSTELRVASGNPEDRHELGCVILILAWK